jgi:hypothetical protein
MRLLAESGLAILDIAILTKKLLLLKNFFRILIISLESKIKNNDANSMLNMNHNENILFSIFNKITPTKVIIRLKIKKKYFFWGTLIFFSTIFLNRINGERLAAIDMGQIEKIAATKKPYIMETIIGFKNILYCIFAEKNDCIISMLKKETIIPVVTPSIILIRAIKSI